MWLWLCARNSRFQQTGVSAILEYIRDNRDYPGPIFPVPFGPVPRYSDDRTIRLRLVSLRVNSSWNCPWLELGGGGDAFVFRTPKFVFENKEQIYSIRDLTDKLKIILIFENNWYKIYVI